MLRISLVHQPDASLILKLEGKLLGPWMEELSRACEAQTSVRLDLAAVTFVDIAGIELLRELIHRGVRITTCSGYVAELLHLEKR
jgi:anti-anti-sigma regulatory factor